MGIGFAIPINEVKAEQGERVSPDGRVLPTPVPTPFPAIGPTPDVEATKRAIDAIDAHRRAVEQATRTAVEAEEEARRYAASLEATRVAELPTPTATATPTAMPTPTPTPTPEPPPTETPRPTPTSTSTPHPRTFCQEWEALVLEWIKQGNIWHRDGEGAPDHPHLTAREGRLWCISLFPLGVLKYNYYPDYVYVDEQGWHSSWAWISGGIPVGTEAGHLLPGLYEYRIPGDNRVEREGCSLNLNYGEENQSRVVLPVGEPFTYRFFEYHNRVVFQREGWNCSGALYRIAD